MKKLITLLLIAVSFSAIAQTNDPVLNKRLAEYLNYSKELNVDQLLTYMYPRVFELGTKKQIKDALEAAFNNPAIDIKLDSVSIGTVLPLSKFSKGSYTKFSYFVKMKIRLTNPKMEDKKDQIFKSFKSTFGEENVTYDETAKIFWVTQHKEALAIKDNYSKNIWTMLGIEKGQKISGILPLEIKNKFNL